MRTNFGPLARVLRAGGGTSMSPMMVTRPLLVSVSVVVLFVSLVPFVGSCVFVVVGVVLLLSSVLFCSCPVGGRCFVRSALNFVLASVLAFRFVSVRAMYSVR